MKRLVLLLCLTLAASREEECDRQRSRHAREIATKYIHQPAEAMKYKLPEGCPLKIDSDKYFWQERHKLRLENGNWKCTFCSKMFVTEGYLDRHLRLRHETEFLPNATQCFADMCPLLHCDYFIDKHIPIVHGCDHARHHQIQTQCEMVMHKCFPIIDSSEAQQLYSFAREWMCQAHVCDASERSQRLYKLEKSHKQSNRMLCYMYSMIILLCVLAFCFNSQGHLVHID